MFLNNIFSDISLPATGSFEYNIYIAKKLKFLFKYISLKTVIEDSINDIQAN